MGMLYNGILGYWDTGMGMPANRRYEKRMRMSEMTNAKMIRNPTLNWKR